MKTADAIERALLRCVAPSRAERFAFFERWTSRAALSEHVGTEHFKELTRELMPLLAYPLDVTVLEALLDD
jgi:quinol monooxygenase YgiN